MDDLFLLGVRVGGRRCAVLGNAETALERARALHALGARVELYAPQPAPALREWALAQGVALALEMPEVGSLAGCLLVTDTEPDPARATLFAEHSRCGSFLYCPVDRTEHCTFVHTAQVRRGPLRISLSTGGALPSLAACLRQRLDALLGHDLSDYFDELAAVRARLAPGERRATLGRMLAAARLELTYHLPARAETDDRGQ